MRSGPKRRLDARYPSGQLRYPRRREPADAVGLWARQKQQVRFLNSHPMWASALAGLEVFRRITDRELQAGLKWAEWRGYYDRLQGLTSRSSASPSYEMGRISKAHHGDVLLTENEEGFLAKFSRAREVVRKAGGPLAEGVLDDVAVSDKQPATDERLARLICVLRALADHWSLTNAP